jgi:pentose-5-phosphate-3-epimerase
MKYANVKFIPNSSVRTKRNAWLHLQGDQKVSVHLMITTQKVTSNVQSVPRQFPGIY